MLTGDSSCEWQIVHACSAQPASSSSSSSLPSLLQRQLCLTQPFAPDTHMALQVCRRSHCMPQDSSFSALSAAVRKHSFARPGNAHSQRCGRCLHKASLNSTRLTATAHAQSTRKIITCQHAFVFDVLAASRTSVPCSTPATRSLLLPTSPAGLHCQLKKNSRSTASKPATSFTCSSTRTTQFSSQLTSLPPSPTASILTSWISFCSGVTSVNLLALPAARHSTCANEFCSLVPLGALLVPVLLWTLCVAAALSMFPNRSGRTACG